IKGSDGNFFERRNTIRGNNVTDSANNSMRKGMNKVRNNFSNTNGVSQFSYPSNYDHETTKKIISRLVNVKDINDARVIVDDNRILIGVDADNTDSRRLDQDVRKKVASLAGNKEVIVVTDREDLNKIQAIDDKLRGGA